MKFESELITARFIKRYKRFFADVEIQGPNGTEIVTAHCPNTGSMRHCLVEGSECWISKSNNPKRKLGYTLEAVTSENGGMAGVNTGLTNKLVKEALLERRIPELADYDDVKAEVKFGRENSRLDFLLSTEESCCYVEVKNVTLGLGGGEGAFPDAVTERGRKHIHELMYAVEQGHRAVLFFCVQHTGIERVRPAWEIDKKYSETLQEAIQKGVEVLAYGVTMRRQEFTISTRLDFSY
ncbi:UNVERIFIED_CONTAM: hypothetical protein GTU68_039682 [Idotea baltica]|nr:hypothetical protein [Idotea baltica]